MRALVTGATGFVGRRLLPRIDDPVVLTRHAQPAREALGDVEIHAWDPEMGPPPTDAFRGVQAVFHLAGEPVAQGRWTMEKKRRIHASRRMGTANLVRGMDARGQRPEVLVSASAVGFYGSRGDEMLVETSSSGDDFLARVCRDWEDASLAARMRGVRVVNPRIGIVLGAGGGALSRMLLPFKLGLGGRLGSGRQWMSWIHVDDLVGMLLHAARDPNVQGAMNAVAPEPVTNRQFTQTLAGVLHRPAVLGVPALALKMALGEFSEVLLSSQRAVPDVALRSGYEFAFTDLREALQAIVAEARGARPRSGIGNGD